MFVSAFHGEKLVREFSYKGIEMQLVSCPQSIWCGALGYAQNSAEEPDIGGLLNRYQQQCAVEKRERSDAAWSCCISIDYWQQGAVPRGMMFAQQVLTAQQDAVYDVYEMPESLFVRVAPTRENAQAAFGRETCELYELFGVIRDALATQGLEFNGSGAQETEMYNHAAGLFFAYVPVKQADR